MNRPLIPMIDKAIKIIEESNNIYIASHVQPDGDSIGSILALGMAIKKVKKEVNIIKVDDIPVDYSFLPKLEIIREYDVENNIDIFISLDSSDLDRLGIGKQFALKANKVINLDHHITNGNFGDINIVSSSSAATGEIVYEFIKRMEIKIDRDMATCLYTAISTDTGSFMYCNTTYKTHLIAAELLKLGIDKDYINRRLYQSKSIERVNLFISSLNKLEYFLDGKIGITVVTQDMLKDNNAKLEDTEGVISFIRDIDSIEVACLLKEINDKETKISMRSKKYVDVSAICDRFNGGGHKRAAGCTIYNKIDIAKELILKEIKNSF